MSDLPKTYLVLPAGPSADATLASAFAFLSPQCVLIVPNGWQPGDPDTTEGELSAAAVSPLVHWVQARDVAVIVADDAELAKATHADGVHLSWSESASDRYATVRSFLDPNAIVGISAGSSRHDAMTLGEGGADYVSFNSNADESENNLAAWWTELFEVPLVAFGCEDLETCQAAIAAGADFLAVNAATIAQDDTLRARLGELLAKSDAKSP